MISVSAHKIGGPKGIGALYLGPRMRNPRPLLPGGGQEGGRRSGTEATAQIAGFAKAVELRMDHLADKLEPDGAAAGLRGGAADGHPRLWWWWAAVTRPISWRCPCPAGPARTSSTTWTRPGHLRLRRLRLPSGQAQPCGGCHGTAQEGLRRCHPPELRAGDHPGGHRRGGPGPASAPRHKIPHAVSWDENRGRGVLREPLPLFFCTT